MSVNMDFLSTNGQAQGEVAAILNNKKMDPSRYKPWINPQDGRTYITVHSGGDKTKPENYKHVPINTNGTLRRDEWKQLDEAVLKVSKERLGGVQDLIDNNLTFNLGNAMGTTVLEWHRSKTDMTAALSMDGLTRGQNDRPVYDTNYLPIPIIHVDYELNARELEQSRSLGNPLSTDDAEEATRTVNERLEDMLFTDETYSFGGGTIYSYMNHPDISTGSLSNKWNASAATASGIKDDVIAMKQDAIDSYHYGPFVIYVPTSYETILDDDYDVSGASTQTIRQRIEALNSVQKVKVIDHLPSDTVLLVEMSSRNVRLVRGMGIQNIEWSSQGGFITNYKVMTIQVPQIRSDKNKTVGIIKYTG